jgi:cyclic pyranopterin phosphate synthase
MIDVGKKRKTRRIARATAMVTLGKAIVKKIKAGTVPKGDVLATARLAGIMAAKNTPSLIPLCHNIGLEYVDLSFTVGTATVRIESTARATAKTGVEMEALAACAAAALTIYDMCKMFSHDIVISDLELLEKRGGKSGVYRKKR